MRPDLLKYLAEQAAAWTEADERRCTHGAPEIIVGVRVSGGMDIVAGRTQSGEDEEIAAIPEERRDGGTPVQRRVRLFRHCPHHFFAPIMRCEISTAIC